jgi:hypothetical protein
MKDHHTKYKKPRGQIKVESLNKIVVLCKVGEREKTNFAFFRSSGFCTATLISPRFVLTVAHCLRAANMTDDDTIQVYYGAANFSQGRLIVRDRSAVHIHPNVTLTYDPSAPFPVQTRDMALLDVGS